MKRLYMLGSLTLLAGCGEGPTAPTNAQLAGAAAAEAASGRSANAQRCKNGGYLRLATSSGLPFTNVDDCVRSATQGGVFPAPGGRRDFPGN
jgi:hypothetical protein